jgi:hypothetical protein
MEAFFKKANPKPTPAPDVEMVDQPPAKPKYTPWIEK